MTNLFEIGSTTTWSSLWHRLRTVWLARTAASRLRNISAHEEQERQQEQARRDRIRHEAQEAQSWLNQHYDGMCMLRDIIGGEVVYLREEALHGGVFANRNEVILASRFRECRKKVLKWDKVQKEMRDECMD